MKAAILFGCLALGLVGCSTYRGGTGTAYETQSGSHWSSDPVYYQYYGPTDSIYPVRKQPSIRGDDGGGVKPLIDPYRQWEMEHPVHYGRDTVVYRSDTWNDQPPAYSGRDPIFNP